MTHTLLLAGGYTDSSSLGIRIFVGSRAEAVSVVDGVEHPSFLALHPNGEVIYAVSETTEFDGRPGGGIVAFRLDRARRSLDEIDRIPSGGDAPCHLAVDRSGSHLFVANYGSGSIAAVALMDDGRFADMVFRGRHAGSGPHPRQDRPHAHCVRPGAGGRSVFAVDLGTDEIIRYERQASAEGTAFAVAGTTPVAPGAGPRHLAFHPTTRLAVVVNELSNTVDAYEVGGTGALTLIDTQPTLPAGAPADGLAADVRFHPRGHRLYVSNRGHDSIAVFAVDESAQPLRPAGHVPSGGRTPRCMAFHPTGRTLYVANQNSNQIVPFTVDPRSGRPDQLDHHYDMDSPTCVVALEVET